MKQKIHPSVIAKNQQALNTLFKKLVPAAHHLHLDIINKNFAPSSSLQFPFRLSNKFTYSAHLMINNPLPWIKKNLFRVDIFIPHIEEIKSPLSYINFMKKKKKPLALALLPETKLSTLQPYIKYLDYILILTVNPGFYGSPYIKKAINRIPLIKKINSKIKIIVDGHMNPITIKDAAQRGADYFVSGSYVTLSDNPKKAILELKKAIKK